ncbi:hypothetical protein RSOL_061890 [Rhizoctonia solani AG-3 Rhs1AP]|uniref:Uncharacterized protein n=2 Tax=Rhizoctonia solani AG-3 TaxID=1086053 RepID=A0A074RRF9_9AGAM|nr:hypothetical protein RSOL_061890 [Rhizoctonia solani AG-3 Rhs1AP]KEP47910.1 hypothetical protein V565_139850 [Rhizoctonia solani 123E]
MGILQRRGTRHLNRTRRHLSSYPRRRVSIPPNPRPSRRPTPYRIPLGRPLLDRHKGAIRSRKLERHLRPVRRRSSNHLHTEGLRHSAKMGRRLPIHPITTHWRTKPQSAKAVFPRRNLPTSRLSRLAMEGLQNQTICSNIHVPRPRMGHPGAACQDPRHKANKIPR